MELLRLQKTGPIARLIIDNPRRRNALNREMWRAIPTFISEASNDHQIRVVALQGSQPGLFAAGADISEFAQTYANPQEAMRANEEIQSAVDSLERCALPVVALIDGPCVGGGLAIATACDFRIASEKARFAVTPAKLGLSYHPQDLRRLVQACGLGAASELLFSAQIWCAQRALVSGLVSQVMNTESFEEQTNALLQSIATNSVDANRALKRGLRAAISGEASAIEQSITEFEQLFTGADFLEGKEAFLEKRPAAFPSHRKSS